jgi:hypothetical protein
MDDFSFYSTIICIALIHISFFWMIQRDHRRQKLSLDAAKRSRLIVVLVARSDGEESAKTEDQKKCDQEQDSDVVDRLRRRLELNNLQVLTVLLSPNGRGSGATGCGSDEGRVRLLRLNKRLDSQIGQLVESLERELSREGLRLLAHVDMLQFWPDHASACDDIASASDRLRRAFKQLAAQHGTRSVVVHDESLPQRTCPFRMPELRTKIDLARIHKEALNLWTCLKQSQSNPPETGPSSVEIHLSSGPDSRFKSIPEALVELITRWGENETYERESQTSDQVEARARADCGAQLIEAVTNAVLLLRPRDTRITVRTRPGRSASI